MQFLIQGKCLGENAGQLHGDLHNHLSVKRQAETGPPQLSVYLRRFRGILKAGRLSRDSKIGQREWFPVEVHGGDFLMIAASGVREVAPR